MDNSKLKEFLKTAPPPSADCCSATTAFNNAYCSCSKEVLDLVKSFTNNNIDQYREGEWDRAHAACARQGLDELD